MVRFTSEPERFRDWVDSHGAGARFAYMGMILFQCFIAFVPGEPFEIAGGYAFGTREGTALCVLACSIGSIGIFLLVRRFGVQLVELFFPREKLRSLLFLQTSPKRKLLFLIIYMLPGTPKDLFCYYAGLTDLSFVQWVLICTLGRFPSIITSTVGGDALGDQNYWFAVIVFAVTLLISGAGLLYYQRMVEKHKQDGNR